MEGKWRKLNLRFIEDGWVEGPLQFLPNIKHVQTHGRLLF